MTNQYSNIKIILNAIVASLLLITSGNLYAESAGKIIAATGNIQVLYADGRLKHMIRRGSEIYSGEIINTSGSARAQMRFKDGTLISLNQNTQFRIDEYKRDRKTKALISSFFSLLQGKFRSITKHVSQRDKLAYRVSTAHATMGVRGTDYEASICASNCAENGEGQLQLKVYEGAIVVSNEAGEFIMEHGEAGFINDIRTPLQLVPALIPTVLGRQTEVLANSEGSRDDQEENHTTSSMAEEAAGVEDIVSEPHEIDHDSVLSEAVVLPEENFQPAVFVTGDAIQCISY